MGDKKPEIVEKCPVKNCEGILVYHQPSKPKAKDYFWKCNECGMEAWPEIKSVKSQLKSLLNEGMKAKKKSGGGNSRKRKSSKPGDKFIPWYQRYGDD